MNPIANAPATPVRVVSVDDFARVKAMHARVMDAARTGDLASVLFWGDQLTQHIARIGPR